MCGICGVVEYNSRRKGHEVIDAMTDAMTHRGPDDKSFYKIVFAKHNVNLGMCRLSIIDREHGKQPFGRTWRRPPLPVRRGHRDTGDRHE